MFEHEPQRVFIFKALRPGKQVLKFTKQKSWENKIVEERCIQVHIKRADKTSVIKNNHAY